MFVQKYFSASESILTKSVQSSPHVQSSPGLRYTKIFTKINFETPQRQKIWMAQST